MMSSTPSSLMRLPSVNSRSRRPFRSGWSLICFSCRSSPSPTPTGRNAYMSSSRCSTTPRSSVSLPYTATRTSVFTTTPLSTLPLSSRVSSTLPSTGSTSMRLRARSMALTLTRATRPGLNKSSARTLRRCSSITGRKPVIWLKKRKKTPLSRSSFTTPTTSSPCFVCVRSHTSGASSRSSERLLVQTSVCWCGITLTTRTRSFFPTGNALRGSFTVASSPMCSGYSTPRICLTSSHQAYIRPDGQLHALLPRRRHRRRHELARRRVLHRHDLAAENGLRGPRQHEVVDQVVAQHAIDHLPLTHLEQRLARPSAVAHAHLRHIHVRRQQHARLLRRSHNAVFVDRTDGGKRREERQVLHRATLAQVNLTRAHAHANYPRFQLAAHMHRIHALHVRKNGGSHSLLQVVVHDVSA